MEVNRLVRLAQAPGCGTLVQTAEVCLLRVNLRDDVPRVVAHLKDGAFAVDEQPVASAYLAARIISSPHEVLDDGQRFGTV
jgi:hypothetical protein